MAFFIGIDGGGTKTNLVLANGDLEILARASAGKTNPVVIGVDRTAGTLLKLIKASLTKTNTLEVDSIAIGLAGCGRKKIADEVKLTLESLLVKTGIGVKKLLVTSDAEIALEGAFPGKAGAILIAGTGSIIYGKNKFGKVFRTGGFGKILGDEGSGYSIGKKGLIAAAKNFDGLGRKTLLHKYLVNHHGISDADSLISKVYSDDFDIANIAKHVIDAASKGDKTCKTILENEALEVAGLLKLLIKKIGVKKIKLSLSGGLLSNENLYSTIIKEKIRKTIKAVELSEPAYPPEIGAVLIAKNINGIKL